MTFIDWSDPDEMLGLLVEYVSDERLAEHGDRSRARFLKELAAALATVASRADPLSTRATIEQLRDIYDSQAPEFGADPVLVHLHDCIEELVRIAEQTATSPD